MAAKCKKKSTPRNSKRTKKNTNIFNYKNDEKLLQKAVVVLKKLHPSTINDYMQANVYIYNDSPAVPINMTTSTQAISIISYEKDLNIQSCDLQCKHSVPVTQNSSVHSYSSPEKLSQVQTFPEIDYSYTENVLKLKKVQADSQIIAPNASLLLAVGNNEIKGIVKPVKSELNVSHLAWNKVASASDKTDDLFIGSKQMHNRIYKQTNRINKQTSELEQSDSLIVEKQSLFNGANKMQCNIITDTCYQSAYKILTSADLPDDITPDVKTVNDISVVAEQIHKISANTCITDSISMDYRPVQSIRKNIDLLVNCAGSLEFSYGTPDYVLHGSALTDNLRADAESTCVHEGAKPNDCVSAAVEPINCVPTAAELTDYVSATAESTDCIPATTELTNYDPAAAELTDCVSAVTKSTDNAPATQQTDCVLADEGPTDCVSVTAEPTDCIPTAVEPNDLVTAAAESSDRVLVAAEPNYFVTATAESSDGVLAAAEPTDCVSATAEPADYFLPTAELTDCVSVAAEPTDCIPSAAEPNDLVTAAADHVLAAAEPTCCVSAAADPADYFLPTTEPIDCVSVAAESTDCIPTAAEPNDFVTAAAESTDHVLAAAETTDCVSVAAEPSDCVSVAAEPIDCVSLAAEVADCISAAAKPTNCVPAASETKECAPADAEPTDFVTAAEKSTDCVPPAAEPTVCVSVAAEPTDCIPTAAEPNDFVTAAVRSTDHVLAAAEPTDCVSAAAETADYFLPTAEQTDCVSVTAEPTDCIPTAAEPNDFVTAAAESTDHVLAATEPTDCVSVAAEPIDCVSPAAELANCISAAAEPTHCVSAATEPNECVPTDAELTDFVTSAEKSTDCIPPAAEPNDFVTAAAESTNCVLAAAEPTDCAPAAAELTGRVPTAAELTDCVSAAADPTKCIPAATELTNYFPAAAESIDCISAATEPTDCVPAESTDYVPAESTVCVPAAAERTDCVPEATEPTEYDPAAAELIDYVSAAAVPTDCVLAATESTDRVPLAAEPNDCVPETTEPTDYITVESTDCVLGAAKPTDCVSAAAEATDHVLTATEPTDCVSAAAEATDFITVAEPTDCVFAAAQLTDFVTPASNSTDCVSTVTELTDFFTDAVALSDCVTPAAEPPNYILAAAETTVSKPTDDILDNAESTTNNTGSPIECDEIFKDVESPDGIVLEEDMYGDDILPCKVLTCDANVDNALTCDSIHNAKLTQDASSNVTLTNDMPHSGMPPGDTPTKSEPTTVIPLGVQLTNVSIFSKTLLSDTLKCHIEFKNVVNKSINDTNARPDSTLKSTILKCTNDVADPKPSNDNLGQYSATSASVQQMLAAIDESGSISALKKAIAESCMASHSSKDDVASTCDTKTCTDDAKVSDTLFDTPSLDISIDDSVVFDSHSYAKPVEEVGLQSAISNFHNVIPISNNTSTLLSAEPTTSLFSRKLSSDPVVDYESDGEYEDNDNVVKAKKELHKVNELGPIAENSLPFGIVDYESGEELEESTSTDKNSSIKNDSVGTAFSTDAMTVNACGSSTNCSYMCSSDSKSDYTKACTSVLHAEPNDILNQIESNKIIENNSYSLSAESINVSRTTVKCSDVCDIGSEHAISTELIDSISEERNAVETPPTELLNAQNIKMRQENDELDFEACFSLQSEISTPDLNKSPKEDHSSWQDATDMRDTNKIEPSHFIVDGESNSTSVSIATENEATSTPHFYLVGDEVLQEVSSAWPTSAQNITILYKPGLTLALMPLFLMENIKVKHLNSKFPLYLVCFIGLLDLVKIDFHECKHEQPLSEENETPCKHDLVTLLISDVKESEVALRKKVLQLKQEISILIPNVDVHVIIPNIQLMDICRYQRHLDDMHLEIFGHKILYSELEQHTLNHNSVVLANLILHLNTIISDSMSTVLNKLPWNLFNWNVTEAFNQSNLRLFPLDNGHVPNCKAREELVERVLQLVKEYVSQDPDTSLIIKHVYFIGDPRLSVLKSVWPANSGVQVVTISSGNVTPATVFETISAECKNANNCLFVVCTNMESYIDTEYLNTCDGHKPCKYVRYKSSEKESLAQRVTAMVQVLSEDRKNSGISCEIAISPILPVNYETYRTVIAESHLAATGHNVVSDLPCAAESNRETIAMAEDAAYVSELLSNLSLEYDIHVLDIPGSFLSEDVMACTSKLINGLNLTEEMSLSIANNTLQLLTKINQIRSSEKLLSKKPLSESVVDKALVHSSDESECNSRSHVDFTKLKRAPSKSSRIAESPDSWCETSNPKSRMSRSRSPRQKNAQRSRSGSIEDRSKSSTRSSSYKTYGTPEYGMLKDKSTDIPKNRGSPKNYASPDNEIPKVLWYSSHDSHLFGSHRSPERKRSINQSSSKYGDRSSGYNYRLSGKDREASSSKCGGQSSAYNYKSSRNDRKTSSSKYGGQSSGYNYESSKNYRKTSSSKYGDQSSGYNYKSSKNDRKTSSSKYGDQSSGYNYKSSRNDRKTSSSEYGGQSSRYNYKSSRSDRKTSSSKYGGQSSEYNYRSSVKERETSSKYEDWSSEYDRSRSREMSKDKSSSKHHRKSTKKKNKKSREKRISLSKDELDRLYQKHVASFQPFLLDPPSHPDYSTWHDNTFMPSVSDQYLRSTQKTKLLFDTWLKRLNNIIDVTWQNKRKLIVDAKRKRERSSSSSSQTTSSTSSSSSDETSAVPLRKKSKKGIDNNANMTGVASECTSLKDDSELPDSRNDMQAVHARCSLPLTAERPREHLSVDPAKSSYKFGTSFISPKLFSLPPDVSRTADNPSMSAEDSSLLLYLSRVEKQQQPVISPGMIGSSKPVVLLKPGEFSRLEIPKAISSKSKVAPVANVLPTSDGDTKSLNVVEILKLLVQVKSKMGVLAGTLPLMLSRVEFAVIRGVVDVASFTSDDVDILDLIKKKLKAASEDLQASFVEKIIVTECMNQLDRLKNMIDLFKETSINFFDMKVLAEVTENFPVTKTMNYISNLLKEFGRPSSESRVLEVFVHLINFRGRL